MIKTKQLIWEYAPGHYTIYDLEPGLEEIVALAKVSDLSYEIWIIDNDNSQLPYIGYLVLNDQYHEIVAGQTLEETQQECQEHLQKLLNEIIDK